MPFYEYQCSNCGHHLEELQTMTEPPLVKCPECGKDTLQRLIGTGSGIIFKGSGFYQTDYKKPETRKNQEADNKAKAKESKSENKIATKTEGKTEGKTETKTETKKAENKTETK